MKREDRGRGPFCAGRDWQARVAVPRAVRGRRKASTLLSSGEGATGCSFVVAGTPGSCVGAFAGALR